MNKRKCFARYNQTPNQMQMIKHKCLKKKSFLQKNYKITSQKINKLRMHRRCYKRIYNQLKKAEAKVKVMHLERIDIRTFNQKLNRLLQVQLMLKIKR